MAKSTAFVLSEESQKAFLQYYRETMLTTSDIRSAQRKRFTEIDKTYQREKNETYKHQQAKAQNKAGNPDPLQDLTVPIVMPQVESAVVYQSSVFLTGIPIFGVVADPKNMDAALQMETKVDADATRGGWTGELIEFFRNGFKYNFAPVEVDWKRETTVSITTDINFSAKEGKPVNTTWAGNSLKTLDPYNTFVDPRVHPSEVYHSAEFAGYTEYNSRIQLKQFISELSDTLTFNVKKAFESASNTRPGNSEETVEDYYVPDINPDIDNNDNYDGDMNWMAWAELAKPATGKKIDYKNAYQKTVLYCKILPNEFGLRVPGANTPQVWKLIIINHKVIIHAERQTNAHGWIPILIGEPNADGLGYQTKSFATNATPFQEVTTSLMQSIIASRRRAISDRTLFDPSRVLAAHMNSDNPAAKIPVRPAAYGKNISDAVYQFPYREDQGVFSISQIRDLIGMSNNLVGQNPARQGQFVKGNKTKSEFDDVMANANGRDQLAAILLESQIFIPMKHIIKINILQFAGTDSLYNRATETEVEIDPDALRQAVLDFKLSDGLVPSDKIIDADSWKVALQVIGSSPQLSGSYQTGQLFSYLMKTQGANVKEFEKPPQQVAYEQALGAWQSLMQVAIEKGIDPKTLDIGEQPKPADFGYNPNPKQQPQQNQITQEI